ncbi:MAG: hypothetical protein ACRDRL_21885, partial [Sciscionella sp.]
AVVISSGFAEQFDAGARQRQLRAVCAEYPGMRVLGPNAEGLMNVIDAIPVGFSPTINYERGLRKLRGGDVAVIAQSGGLGFALFNDGLGRGLGFSHVVSTGNEVDLDAADIAEYLIRDSATRVLLLFVEGLTPPGRLTALAVAAKARNKVVIVAKVGTTVVGRRAAMAHTGHDAGDESDYAAIIAGSGILRARDQEERVDLALAFSRTKHPAGPRVGIVTTSGGAGTWVADDLLAEGLEVPELSDALQGALRQLIPAYGSPRNPVDATAQVLGRGGIAGVVELVARSGEVDSVVLIATLADAQQVAREKVRLAEIAAGIPLVLYSYTRPSRESVELAGELGLAYFTSARRTAVALRALSCEAY